MNQQKEQEYNRMHWSVLLADKVLEAFPDKEVYTCAAGISPSGTVHFGNFRDIITSYAVASELKKRGKKVRMIFSWDNFDRLRKIPMNVDQAMFKYIGFPLSKVPSPDGKAASWAEFFQNEFEDAMKQLGIELTYIRQTDMYESGAYDKQIIHAMQNREKIARILLSFMTDKGKELKGIDDEEYVRTFYPIAVYSRFSGTDNTEITNYDGNSTITYSCLDTGKSETIDFTQEHIVKLAWKPDWAMRWGFEGVTFEPGGRDHSSPGGSYDTSCVIAREVFGVTPPVYQGYDFVGIRGLGTKMSGSKGNAISPSKMLDIYTPDILKWLYFRAEPLKSFSLAFDSEVIRQYTEFDADIAKLKSGEAIDNFTATSLMLSGAMVEKNNLPEIPFRHAVAFGQIVNWNVEKLKVVFEAMDFHYHEQTIPVRLEKAKSWLLQYNESEMVLLRTEPNAEFIATLSDEQKNYVRVLARGLDEMRNADIKALNTLVYGVVRDDSLSEEENAKRQREFFKIVYTLLLGKDTGPRLSTYFWAIEDRDHVIRLLTV